MNATLPLIFFILVLLASCKVEIHEIPENGMVSVYIPENNTGNNSLKHGNVSNVSYNVSNTSEISNISGKPEKDMDRNWVTFWLGTKYGAIGDFLYEGETKIYVIEGYPYKVTLVFVSQGQSLKGEALFSVNGKLLKPLSRKRMDYFDHKEFIFVKDVHYKKRYPKQNDNYIPGLRKRIRSDQDKQGIS